MPTRTRAAPTAASTTSAASVEHVHHVHFLVDGVSLGEKVWVRGEELTVKGNGDPLFHRSDGTCLLAMTAQEQMMRFGQVSWAAGPWPYGGYDPKLPLDNPSLTLSEQEVAALEKINAQRHLQPLTPRSMGR